MRQKNNKIRLVFLVSIFLVLFMSMSTVMAFSAEQSVSVASYKVTPEVIMPKDTGVISITIGNNGSESAKIEKVTLNSPDLKSLSDDYSRVGELGPGASITLLFKFKAPAAEGIYLPEIWIDVFNSTMIKYPILVNVNTEYSTIKEPAIEVEKVFSDSIKPGDELDVTLILTNKGLSKANDVNVRIEIDPQIPISLKSPNNFYIEGIESKESYELDVEFLSNKNAKLGLYSIPISISYSGVDGNPKQQKETLGVQIKGDPEISIASISSDPARIVEGDFVTLLIKVENTGTDDAKSVKASVDLPFDGVKSVFLGKIEPDENVPAVFTIDVDKGGIYTYNVNISYENDGKIEEISQSSELVVTGPDQVISSGMLIPILFVVAIIVGPTILFSMKIFKKNK